MSMQDILTKAVQTEELGYRFYTEQAGKSQNPLAKALLQELAADEQRHAGWFRRLLDQVTAGDKVTYPSEAADDIESRMKATFEGFAPAPGAATQRTQEDVLKMAIALERESFGVYDGLYLKAASDQEKSFFDRLRREEYDHLAALENVLMYLTRTGMWFDIEESKRWNWMV